MSSEEVYSTFPFSYKDRLTQIMGVSKPANYIRGYVEGLECTTVLVEEEYVDRFYMVDYSMYYSRSFENIPKFCKRVHFFKDIDEEILKERLGKDGNDLNDHYIGFTVVKPIFRGRARRPDSPDSRNLFSIGRTVLRPYDEVNRSSNKLSHRHFIKTCNSVSLFGTRLSVKALPFTSQDLAVGGCASSSLWVAQFPLNQKYGTSIRSIYEITELATTPSPVKEAPRRFPSSGLSIGEILFVLSKNGLEYDSLSPHQQVEVEWLKSNANFEDEGVSNPQRPLSLSIKTFVDANVPLIVGLKAQDDTGSKSLHAVVVTGYSESDGKIDKIYIHDDTVGPYARITIEDNLLVWKYERGDRDDTTSLSLEFMIIPQHHKIRYSYPKIMDDIDSDRKLRETDYTIRLMEISEYKAELLGLDIPSLTLSVS